MNNVHFKMFKSGKKWMVMAIATSAMAGGLMFLTPNNASADVVANAQAYTGAPYAYGGNSADTGIDCSALVQQAYAADGITIPRDSASQYAASTIIDASQAQAGDLVFFGPAGATHVGIYQGNGQMVDAETTGVVSGQYVSAMEASLGAASYGRIVGGSTAANNTSAVVNRRLMNFAVKPKADNSSQNVTPDAGTTVDSANTATDTSNDANETPTPALVDNSNNASNASSIDNTTSTPTTSSDTDASTPVDQTKLTDTTNETAKTDAGTQVTNNQAKAVSENKQNALPDTGVKNNSFLSVIGLALVSLVTFFAVKIRKFSK